MKLYFLIYCSLFIACASKSVEHPKHWWSEIPKHEAKWWEILPQEAKDNEVILSKRNELGILSNFAATPFKLDGQTYTSVEGFWQMMKFPEGKDDPRSSFVGVKWPFQRQEVANMVGFQAKKAGSKASGLMEKMGIPWVTYKGQKIPYRRQKKGKHYEIIRQAMKAKLQQNKKVREILMSTGNLVLKPDHKQKANVPPAWKYHEIWMELRAELQQEQPQSN